MAVLRGLRPTALILRKQPHSKWNELDFLLLEAYQIFDDEMSKTTGLPIWISRNPEMKFDVDTYVDAAQAMLDDWDDKRKNDGKKAFGRARFVVPQGESGDILEYGGAIRHSFREAAALQAREQREDQDQTQVGLDGKYAILPED